MQYVKIPRALTQLVDNTELFRSDTLIVVTLIDTILSTSSSITKLSIELMQTFLQGL